MPHDFQADIDAICAIPSVPAILDVVCRITGMRFSAIARVTEERWVTCAVRDEIAFGLTPGAELAVQTTICNEIRQHRQLVVIDHVADDPAYCNHHTPAAYGIQSYISVPILMPNGDFFGTLCAIDPAPRTVNTPETVGTFRLFAELIAFHLDAHSRLAATEASLMTEREASELREQFIAVLGHDLRNPVAALDAGLRLLQRGPAAERAAAIMTQMQASLTRMTGLISNVLDFARGRLGGGLSLERRPHVAIEPMLNSVVAEMRTASGRTIEAEFSALAPVDCDPGRIGQLLSNLLGNAIAYGAPDTPISVTGTTEGGRFTLAVRNVSEPIPPAVLANLFKPFFRAAQLQNQQGLGLGLFIASEIARAHGGTLTAQSADGVTVFTFEMPQSRA